MITHALREHSCDLLFEFRFKNDKRDGKVHYILLEFKSYFDKTTLWQISKYHILTIDNHEKLYKGALTEIPHVVKLVIHTGSGSEELVPISSLYKTIPGWEEIRLHEPSYILVRLTEVSLQRLKELLPDSIDLVLLKLDSMGPKPELIIETLEEYLEFPEGQVLDEFADLLTDYLLFLCRYEANDSCIDKILEYFNVNKLEKRGIPMTQKARKILRQGIPSACRAIGVEEGLEKGIQKGLQKGIQKGLQDGLRKALLDMMAKRFRVVPETLGEKLCLIQEPDLLNGWVVNFNEYKKLKNFEQDVDAALRQQAMA